MSYEQYIARALATQGGHLSIGRGGFTLHYDNARLSGYDCDAIKAEAIAAGLPVIDSRDVPFEIVAVLAVSGPMVAVHQDPSARPWHGLAYAPLSYVAAAYRHAGAEVHHIGEEPDATAWFDSHPPGPIADILRLRSWLENIWREAVLHA
ncbi:MAG: hypothetical protein JOZ05_14315 [Acetobacteraceae bacterium]|nr:hypothetical protein [Acetobacteraceae bacterium]